LKLNLTSRRYVAVRRLLAIAALGLGLVLASVVPATAQRGGGGHGGGGHGGGGIGGGDMRDRGSNQPTSQPRPQSLSGLQLGLGGRWWDDHKTVKKLNLRPDQQQRMDDIFEANKPALITLYTDLQREETRLASLSPADLQDESKVFAAIDRVSHARSDLEKEDAHVLLQIRQQLDPQQLQALDRQIASLH
jgi:Spy/CpxP family protein refolding chaperone